MSSTEDPPRWSSATSGLPNQLVVGLEEARAVAPAPEQMAHMRSGLAPILVLGAAATMGGAASSLATADAAAKASGVALGQAGATSAASGVSWGLVVAKLAPFVLVLGGVAGVVWVARSSNSTLIGSANKKNSAQKQGTANAPTSPSGAPRPSPSSPAEGSVELPPSTRAPLPAPSVDAPGAHQERESSPGLRGNEALLAEGRLLSRARTELKASPGEALLLCRQHQNEFPNGVLTQEREVIATEALVHLGRLSEARERVARFRSRFSGSPHLAKLEALTQQPVTQ